MSNHGGLFGGLFSPPSGTGVEVTGGYIVPTGELTDEQREQVRAAGGKVVDLDKETYQLGEQEQVFQPNGGFDFDLNPTASGDGTGFPSIPEVPGAAQVRALVILVVAALFAVAFGQLFNINIGDSTS
jgi:hypothetical protein